MFIRLGGVIKVIGRLIIQILTILITDLWGIYSTPIK